MRERAEHGLLVPSYEILHPDGPIISVFPTPEATRAGLVLPVLSTIINNPGTLGLVATGHTFEPFYPLLIDAARKYGVDLASIDWSHLDNYVWRRDKYPDGPGPEDFGNQILKWLIKPAGIPLKNFHPIDGWVYNPGKYAFDHDLWLRRQIISFALYGLGKPPEVHAGYMLKNTPDHRGFHYTRISESTLARNIARGEHKLEECMTIGPDTVASVMYNFVMAIGKPEEIELALVKPITPEVNATLFRQKRMRNVRFFLDAVSAEPLKNLKGVRYRELASF